MVFNLLIFIFQITNKKEVSLVNTEFLSLGLGLLAVVFGMSILFR